MDGEALPLNTDISLYTSSRTTVTNSGADASYSYFTNPDSPGGQRPCRRSPYPLTITRRERGDRGFSKRHRGDHLYL
jgi:hypothetical protein